MGLTAELTFLTTSFPTTCFACRVHVSLKISRSLTVVLSSKRMSGKYEPIVEGHVTCQWIYYFYTIL